MLAWLWRISVAAAALWAIGFCCAFIISSDDYYGPKASLVLAAFVPLLALYALRKLARSTPATTESTTDTPLISQLVARLETCTNIIESWIREGKTPQPPTSQPTFRPAADTEVFDYAPEFREDGSREKLPHIGAGMCWVRLPGSKEWKLLKRGSWHVGVR